MQPILSNYSSMSQSQKPFSALRYPNLLNAQSGRQVGVEQDALGRALVRNPERPNSANDFFPSGGGIAHPKGPETYSDAINDAQQMSMSPQSPGGIGGLTKRDYQTYLPETGGTRPPSARLQALAAIRKSGPNAFQNQNS